MARLEVPVFRVSTKHTHDAAEPFDGVPSMYDAKAAQVLAWLQLQKRSKPWPIKSDEARDVAAAADSYEFYNAQLMACLGRLEARAGATLPGAPRDREHRQQEHAGVAREVRLARASATPFVHPRWTSGVAAA